MGPRLNSRGNTDASLATDDLLTLQWGRDYSVAEIFAPIAQSSASRKGFNGAATIQARKSGAARSDRVGVCHASMGPRLFSRGNTVFVSVLSVMHCDAICEHRELFVPNFDRRHGHHSITSLPRSTYASRAARAFPAPPSCSHWHRLSSLNGDAMIARIAERPFEFGLPPAANYGRKANAYGTPKFHEILNCQRANE